MSLLERIQKGPTALLETDQARCNCRFPDRHYGSTPCQATNAELPLGPEGYCWNCWSARHDLPPDERPVWLRNLRAKDLSGLG